MARILHWYPLVEASGSKNRDPNQNRLEETFVAVVDADVTRTWILANIPIDTNFECYSDPGFYWDDIKATQKKRFEWEIKATATAIKLEEWKENPLSRPAVITGSGTTLQQPTNFDYKGRPICSQAGELFSGVMEERPQLVFHVEKNVGKEMPELEDMLGAFNEDAVTIRGRARAQGTLKFTNLNYGNFTTENRVRFMVLSFDLVWDHQTHQVRRWNRGTLELFETDVTDEKTGKKKKAFVQRPILTATSPKKYVDEAVFLDAKGKVIQGQLQLPDSKEQPPFDVSKLIELKWYTKPGLKRFNGVLPLK
jgi:hypothetical protein